MCQVRFMKTMVLPQKMKCVSFCENKESSPPSIESVENNGDCPASSKWYTGGDYEGFRANRDSLISRFIDYGDSDDDDDDEPEQDLPLSDHCREKHDYCTTITTTCIRGLEVYSSTARTSHVKAILDQQKEHRGLDINDPKGLSMLSKSLSKGNRKLAALFGNVDRKEVLRIWEQEGGGSQEEEDLQSEYYQLSATIVRQFANTTVSLNDGRGYSPRLGQSSRKTVTNLNEKTKSLAPIVSRRPFSASRRRNLGSSAA